MQFRQSVRGWLLEQPPDGTPFRRCSVCSAVFVLPASCQPVGCTLAPHQPAASQLGACWFCTPRAPASCQPVACPTPRPFVAPTGLGPASQPTLAAQVAFLFSQFGCWATDLTTGLVWSVSYLARLRTKSSFHIQPSKSILSAK